MLRPCSSIVVFVVCTRESKRTAEDPHETRVSGRTTSTTTRRNKDHDGRFNGVPQNKSKRMKIFASEKYVFSSGTLSLRSAVKKQNFYDSCFCVLCYASSGRQLLILEAIFIHLRNPGLHIQKEHITALTLFPSTPTHTCNVNFQTFNHFSPLHPVSTCHRVFSLIYTVLLH